MSALGDLGARMDRATAATRNLADGLFSAAAEIRRGAETASKLQEDLPSNRAAGRCGFAVDRAMTAGDTLESLARQLLAGIGEI